MSVFRIVVLPEGGRYLPEDKLASSVGASRVRCTTWMVSKPKGKQVPISGYYDPDTVRRLLRLSEVTRVPQAVYLREALEDLLGKYASILRKAK